MSKAHGTHTGRSGSSAAPTGQLPADRAAIATAASSRDTVPINGLAPLSPVTAPCRVIAQMTNFARPTTAASILAANAIPCATGPPR